jgi:hypothetical protein
VIGEDREFLTFNRRILLRDVRLWVGNELPVDGRASLDACKRFTKGVKKRVGGSSLHDYVLGIKGSSKRKRL